MRLSEQELSLKISIHALREEGDAAISAAYRIGAIFLSTPSARRATNTGDLIPVYLDFYPRPPRGGRHLQRAKRHIRQRNFYPRPPRGGRPGLTIEQEAKVEISIHALREEGDSQFCKCYSVISTFLSTPSARRATESGN